LGLDKGKKCLLYKHYLRAQATASQQEKASPELANKEDDNQSDKPYHVRSLSWAQRRVTGGLERVFNVDVAKCEKCQKYNETIIAYIIDTDVIEKILAYCNKIYPNSSKVSQLPPRRAPPNEQHDIGFAIQRDFDFGAPSHLTRYCKNIF